MAAAKKVETEKLKKVDIEKAIGRLAPIVKDTVVANVVRAVSAKEVQIEKDKLDRLIMVVKASVDAGMETFVRGVVKQLS